MSGGHWVINITNKHFIHTGLERGPEFLSIYIAKCKLIILTNPNMDLHLRQYMSDEHVQQKLFQNLSKVSLVIKSLQNLMFHLQKITFQHQVPNVSTCDARKEENNKHWCLFDMRLSMLDLPYSRAPLRYMSRVNYMPCTCGAYFKCFKNFQKFPYMSGTCIGSCLLTNFC